MAVVDEANIETHGMKPMGRISDDPYWEVAYVDRVRRMVQSHRNHACIVIWSLGNESGDGRNLVKARQWVQKADPSRPIQYESGGELLVRLRRAERCESEGHTHMARLHSLLHLTSCV